MDTIEIINAKTHNLKDVSLVIPKHKMVGIAGVSGSGKSSLVSTLAAKAQQSYTTLFPPFVQARMKTLDPGVVDNIKGLTFTAIVGQKKFSKNIRSSVGTVVGIAPYLRLLFSRLANPSAGFSPFYSPNDPRGMCKKCAGLGYIDDINLKELIDSNKSLNQGAVRFPSFEPGTYRWKRLVCSGIVDANTPWKYIPKDKQRILLYGKGIQLKNPLQGYPKHGKFDGIIPRLKDSYLEKVGAKITKNEEAAIRRIVNKTVCPECNGQRLNEAARVSKINGLNIADVSNLSIVELIEYLEQIREKKFEELVNNILVRCNDLCQIGLGYLSLDRTTDSLSGGESQRLRIVGLLGTSITDATFIMDEPSSGLHPEDIEKLLNSLKKLRDSGNTLIVVEHNIQILNECDYIIELGPGAGDEGGELLFEGTPKALSCITTPTGNAMKKSIRLNNNTIMLNQNTINVNHANMYNLKDLSVKIPKNALTVISGVAGSGKSSLVSEIAEQNPEVTVIEQVPLMASSRSSILTVLNLDELVRGAFSKVSGLDKSWFSSNGKGACPVCNGHGTIRIDMAFMDDVESVCEQCNGKRFNEKSLSVKLPYGERSVSIADVLEANLNDVKNIFINDTEIKEVVDLLQSVGLGYLKLGQTLDTLSGGELQRVKLVKFLKDYSKNKSEVLVLDEITTGLHPSDVDQLIKFIRKLISDGFTLIIIDHNLMVISKADYNIDMGPGSGKNGGEVIFRGTPTELVNCKNSKTGKWLFKFSNGERNV